MTTACLLVLWLLALAAAVVDARTRTLPNVLAVAFAAAGAFTALAAGGTGLLGAHALAAVAACAALTAFELVWRRARGAAGLGMGDVKFLFGLMLAAPLLGLASFMGGLVLLAACGLALRRPSLPLLPFVVIAGSLLAASALL